MPLDDAVNRIKALYMACEFQAQYRYVFFRGDPLNPPITGGPSRS